MHSYLHYTNCILDSVPSRTLEPEGKGKKHCQCLWGTKRDTQWRINKKRFMRQNRLAEETILNEYFNIVNIKVIKQNHQWSKTNISLIQFYKISTWTYFWSSKERFIQFKQRLVYRIHVQTKCNTQKGEEVWFFFFWLMSVSMVFPYPLLLHWSKLRGLIPLSFEHLKSYFLFRFYLKIILIKLP